MKEDLAEIRTPGLPWNSSPAGCVYVFNKDVRNTFQVFSCWSQEEEATQHSVCLCANPQAILATMGGRKKAVGFVCTYFSPLQKAPCHPAASELPVRSDVSIAPACGAAGSELVHLLSSRCPPLEMNLIKSFIRPLALASCMGGGGPNVILDPCLSERPSCLQNIKPGKNFLEKMAFPEILKETGCNPSSFPSQLQNL